MPAQAAVPIALGAASLLSGFLASRKADKFAKEQAEFQKKLQKQQARDLRVQSLMNRLGTNQGPIQVTPPKEAPKAPSLATENILGGLAQFGGSLFQQQQQSAMNEALRRQLATESLRGLQQGAPL